MLNKNPHNVQKILHKVYANSNLTKQKQLADELGIASSSISEWKSKERIPDAQLDQLCKISGLTRSELLDITQGESDIDNAVAVIRLKDYTDTITLPENQPLVGIVLGQPDTARPRGTLEHYMRLPVIAPWLSDTGKPAIQDKQGLAVSIPANVGKAETLCVMVAHGADMAPVIQGRDLLIIDRSKTRPMHGGLFAVAVAGSILIRRCDLSRGELAWSAETGQFLAAENITIVGQVLRLCRDL